MSGTDQLLTVAEHFKPLFEKTVEALCKDVTEELEKYEGCLAGHNKRRVEAFHELVASRALSTSQNKICMICYIF